MLEANGLIVAGQTAACMRLSYTESNHCPHIGDKPEVVPKRPCRQGWGGSSGWTQGAGADAAYLFELQEAGRFETQEKDRPGRERAQSDCSSFLRSEGYGRVTHAI